ncbi:MAG: hypothetical protein MUD14_23460 [Hydrococcus sp. Prado102]|jgi:hypothetical protein|nr:hypothetical protein [Hydrococcus sp. Prado102]
MKKVISIALCNASLILSSVVPPFFYLQPTSAAATLTQFLDTGSTSVASVSVEQQVERAVAAQIRSEMPTAAEEYTLQVTKIVVIDKYAYVNWALGEGGGMAIAINRDNRWQVSLYGDDWEGISRLEKNGIPRPIAEQLLDRAFPDWRQWETQ